MAEGNILHRIYVEMRMQDHLTRPLEKAAREFADAERAQKEFDASLREGARAQETYSRTVDKIAQQELRAAQARQRSISGHQASLGRYNETQAKVQRKGQEAWDNYYAALQAKRQAEVARRDQYYSNLQRAEQEHQNRMASLSNRRAGMQHNVLSGEEYSAAITNRDQLRAEIRALEQQWRTSLNNGREYDVLSAQLRENGSLVDAQTAADIAAAEYETAQNLERQLRARRSALSVEEKRLKANQEYADVQAQITQELDTHTQQITAMQAAEEARHEQWLTDNAREEEQLQQKMDLQMQMYDAQLAKEEELVYARTQAHELAMGQLAAEKVARDAAMSSAAVQRAEAGLTSVDQALFARAEAQRQHATHQIVSGAGMALGAGLATGFLLHSAHGSMEAYGENQSLVNRLYGLGLTPRQIGIVTAMAQAQYGNGVNMSEALESFIFAHSATGGIEGVLGKNLNNTSLMTMFNRAKFAGNVNYGMSENALENLFKAAELTSQSATVNRNGNIVPADEDTRRRTLMHRFGLAYQVNEALGGQLRTSEILGMTRQLGSYNFALSDEGFLKLAFLAQEMGGRQTGTAVTSFMGNMQGQQAQYINAYLAQLGLLHVHDSSVVMGKQGPKKFNPLTAMTNGKEIFTDPEGWMAHTLGPALIESLRKRHIAITTANLASELSVGVHGALGVKTAQRIAMLAIMQDPRLEQDLQRALLAPTIDQDYAKAAGSTPGIDKKFQNAQKRLNQAWGGAVSGPMAFLESGAAHALDFLSAGLSGNLGQGAGATLFSGALLGAGTVGAVGLKSIIVNGWKLAFHGGVEGMMTRSFAAALEKQAVQEAAEQTIAQGAGSGLLRAVAESAIWKSVASRFGMAAGAGILEGVGELALPAGAFYAAGLVLGYAAINAMGLEPGGANWNVLAKLMGIEPMPTKKLPLSHASHQMTHMLNSGFFGSPADMARAHGATFSGFSNALPGAHHLYVHVHATGDSDTNTRAAGKVGHTLAHNLKQALPATTPRSKPRNYSSNMRGRT